ncbi:MAG: hypothetical protein A2Y86_01785 [Candidatus Aminicenantes bacterium RBG_13_62_12]|nr:MAG: hypothetical protein A2Y86_01785 [Candidatus Aminicenantes bacterium RBG_13_62_12]
MDQKKEFVAVFLLILASAVGLGAQEPDKSVRVSPQDRQPLAIGRLAGPVTLDGRSDEEAWAGAALLPVSQLIPAFGLPPSEKTEVLLGYDDAYLYVAARNYDREPGKMLCSSKKRDYMEPNTEWFGILLDTFNDKETGLAFYTTPTGLRFDASVFNDGTPTEPNAMPINLSWNTFWDAAAFKDDRGWFAEMRIPFSSLRFQDRQGRVVMGLIVIRYIARKSEYDCFPSIFPQWGGMTTWKPSQAREIVLDGVQSRKPLYITPYGLAGYGQSNKLNDEETAYVHEDQPVLEGGLDLKYGLSSNLTLDLTLNTDFAQVEADDVQVNLTRFSLFFPEKRLFFQERASIFDFSFGSSTMIFHSRTIGIHEGEAVRIYGGMRLIGRLGEWDLGFLDMQTAAVEGLHSENFGVLRLKKKVLNPFSYMGGILATRLGTDGSYNVVYGLDGSFRLSADDYLLLNWAQSFETGKANNAASLDLSRFRLGWERRTIKGFGASVNAMRRGEDYEPGMGFEILENYGGLKARLTYGWMPGDRSSFQNHYLAGQGHVILRNEDGSLLMSELAPGWGFNARSGAAGEFAFVLSRESLQESFELSDEVEVLPGEYSFFGFRGNYMTAPGRLLYAVFTLEGGKFYDGNRLSLTAAPTWAVAPDISLSGLYQFNRVLFPERGQEYTAHVVRLRLLATLSIKFSAIAFVQYNSADRAAVANIRLRFNPREGNDLYLVINETFNTRLSHGAPRRPAYSDRAVMLKYSYTFSL